MAAYIVLKRYEDAFRILEELIRSSTTEPLPGPPQLLARQLRLDAGHCCAKCPLPKRPTPTCPRPPRAGGWTIGSTETIEIDVQALPSRTEDIIRSWFRQLLVKHYQDLLVDGVVAGVYFRLGREAQRLKLREALGTSGACSGNPEVRATRISMDFCYKDLGRAAEAWKNSGVVPRLQEHHPETILFSNESEADEDGRRKGRVAARRDPHPEPGPGAETPVSPTCTTTWAGSTTWNSPTRRTKISKETLHMNPFFIRAIIGQALTLMQLNQTEGQRAAALVLTTRNSLFWKVVQPAMLHRQADGIAQAADTWEELLPLPKTSSPPWPATCWPSCRPDTPTTCAWRASRLLGSYRSARSMNAA